MCMANKSNKKNSNPKRQEEVLCAALKKFGFVFPTTPSEVEQFEEVFGTTEIDLPDELQDGQFLTAALEPTAPEKPAGKTGVTAKEATAENKVIPISSAPTNVDYYRRTLLAAEIVCELHQEMTLGHVKLQKLIFLSQRTENIRLPVNFLKQAMGPYDPRMMRSIDKQLLEKKWFQFLPTEKLKYKPLEKAGAHKTDFERFYSSEKEKISWLIETFKKVKTDRVEIIATLFACWEELLKEEKEASQDNLITRFFRWSTDKQKFTKLQVKTEIPWMIENNLVPIQ
jgi:type I restriction enzyme, S subunit